MSEQQRTALVTGANKGIGYEIAAGLGALGWAVGVGARDDGRREEAVARLHEQGVDAFGVPLDVTDDDSVAGAARLLQERGGGLRALVNNAGVTGGGEQRPTLVDVEAMRAAVEVNVFGVVRATNAVLPMLREAPSPRIVFVSSSVGSLSRQTQPGPRRGPLMAAYSPSKTYLNAVMIQYVKDLDGTGILVNAACPGFVATDLNGFRGHRSAEQGAATPIRLATLPDDGPTGGFFNDDGEVPW